MTKNPTDPENEKMMNEDYLWDASGTPDPEIQRLESLLADFRHADRALVLPAKLPAARRKFRALLIPMLTLPRLAAAAAILLAAGLTLFFFTRPKPAPETGPAWDVANLQGAPQIGAKAIAANQASGETPCRPDNRHQCGFPRFPLSCGSRRNPHRSQLPRAPRPDRRKSQTHSTRRRHHSRRHLGAPRHVRCRHAFRRRHRPRLLLHSPRLARWLRRASHHVWLGRLSSPWPRLLHPCRCHVLHSPRTRPGHSRISKTPRPRSAKRLPNSIRARKIHLTAAPRSPNYFPKPARTMLCPSGIFSHAPTLPSAHRSTPASPCSFHLPKASLASASSISTNPCSTSGGTPSASAKFPPGVSGNNPLPRNRRPTPSNCSRKNSLAPNRSHGFHSAAQLSAHSANLTLPLC